MGTLDIGHLQDGALLLLDSSPVIYYFEDRPNLADRYQPIFEAHAEGNLRLAVTPITITEVLVGPLQIGDERAARRYRAIFETWEFVGLTVDIADSAARIRASHRLRLPDAFQAASALAVDAVALVTHDRDFPRVRGLRVIA
jgi:predicted nucleic acid-binding protein